MEGQAFPTALFTSFPLYILSINSLMNERVIVNGFHFSIVLIIASESIQDWRC